MNGLRVLHLTPALFGDEGVYGGAERYGFELARYMAAVTPTTLAAFGDKPQARVTSEGLCIRVLGPAARVRGQPFNRIHRGLFSVLRAADVIHCHQPRMLASELAAIAGRLTGRRVVATDLGGGGWGFSAYLRTDRWFHGHLHISNYSRQVSDHGKNARASVIYGGVDTELFCPDDRTPREPLVVFVGRLLPHKGIDNLVRALPEGVTLELIGRPYDERYYRDLQALAAGKRVIFRQDCDDREIVRAYRRAICVVLPSVYRTMYGEETRVPELLGQTLLEGMACETPAVCTDVAGMPEVVAHGETGFVVPPYDPDALRAKLEFLRDRPEEVRRMGAEGRRRVLRQFGWPRVVDRCLEAYRGRLAG